jgi:Uma2 family endonuclease
MAAQSRTILTAQEYLARERTSEIKHEYLAGEVRVLAGGSQWHNRITGNALASLHAQLRHRPCTVYPSDMRLAVPSTHLYTYADVTVICGEEQFEDDQLDVLLNPTVIVDVLSPSTERDDRGRKFQQYRQIGSFREYLLIAQDTPRIEHYVRQPDNQWLLTEATGLDARLTLPSIGCELALADVYAKVTFGQPADTPPAR